MGETNSHHSLELIIKFHTRNIQYVDYVIRYIDLLAILNTK